MTPDLETTSLLTQLVTILVGALLGIGGDRGIQSYQRRRAVKNGSFSDHQETDFNAIITAVQRASDRSTKESKEIIVVIKAGEKERRTVLRDAALAELRIELAKKGRI